MGSQLEFVNIYQLLFRTWVHVCIHHLCLFVSLRFSIVVYLVRVWLIDNGQTVGQWGDPSSAASSGPSFKIWLKDRVGQIETVNQISYNNYNNAGHDLWARELSHQPTAVA